MTTKQSKGENPILPLPEPEPDPIQVQVVPRDRREVGVVKFEDASGLDNGWAWYHVPAALRDRTLQWRYQLHEQNHQIENDVWVYRLTSTSGVGAEEKDEHLEPIEPPVEGPKA